MWDFIYQNQTFMLAENRTKKNLLKKYILCENFKIKKNNFFLNTRMWSDMFPFETFAEIGWEFSEIFDFGYLLGSDCTKMLFHTRWTKCRGHSNYVRSLFDSFGFYKMKAVIMFLRCGGSAPRAPLTGAAPQAPRFYSGMECQMN